MRTEVFLTYHRLSQYVNKFPHYTHMNNIAEFETKSLKQIYQVDGGYGAQKWWSLLPVYHFSQVAVDHHIYTVIMTVYQYTATIFLFLAFPR